jgi:hypothetical protein
VRVAVGRSWRQVLAPDETPAADGEIVWSWRRDPGATLAELSAGHGGKKGRSPGRARISRQTIARGKPGCSGCTRRFSPCPKAHGISYGCIRHPAFPAPSLGERDNELAKSGQSVSRQRGPARAALQGLRSSDLAKGWLGNLDSNQDKQSQSLLCYRYTIPQWNYPVRSIAYLAIRVDRLRRGQDQITARWWRRSTRLILSLASADAGRFCGRNGRKNGVWCGQRSATPSAISPRVSRKILRLPNIAPACAKKSQHSILRPTTDAASPSRAVAQLAGPGAGMQCLRYQEEEKPIPPLFARAKLFEKAHSLQAYPLETIT